MNPGNIVIAVLISTPGFAFAQAPEKETTAEPNPVGQVEKSKTDSAETIQKVAPSEKVKPVEIKKVKTKKVVSVGTTSPKTRAINGVKKQSGVGYLIAIDENEFVIDLGSNDGLKSERYR